MKLFLHYTLDKYSQHNTDNKFSIKPTYHAADGTTDGIGFVLASHAACRLIYLQMQQLVHYTVKTQTAMNFLWNVTFTRELHNNRKRIKILSQ